MSLVAPHTPEITITVQSLVDRSQWYKVLLSQKGNTDPGAAHALG